MRLLTTKTAITLTSDGMAYCCISLLRLTSPCLPLPLPCVQAPVATVSDWEFLQYGFRARSCSPDLKGCSGFPLSFPLVIHRSAEVAGARVLPRRSAVSSRLCEPGNLPELTCFCMSVSHILFSFCQSPYWLRNRRLCLTASAWIITIGSEGGVEATGAMTTRMMVRKYLNWTKERKLMDVSAPRGNIINI